MDDAFDPNHIAIAVDDDDLWDIVGRHGTMPDGSPNMWGRGFLQWYLAGGRVMMEDIYRGWRDAERLAERHPEIATTFCGGSERRMPDAAVPAGCARSAGLGGDCVGN